MLLFLKILSYLATLSAGCCIGFIISALLMANRMYERTEDTDEPNP